jgi:hypothetical protein
MPCEPTVTRFDANIESRSGTRTADATTQCMVEGVGAMTEGQLQIALDGPDADLEPRRDLVRPLPFDRNAAEHFAGPRWQLRQCTFESLDFRTRLSHLGRIRSVIADIQKRVDLRCADAVILRLLTVLRDIDRGTKDEIGRTAHGFGVRDPVQTQKRLVQSLVGEIGRSQPTGEFADQAVVVLDQLPP